MPQNSPISFNIIKKLSDEMPGKLGRAGVLETPHGKIETPAFVTVGTKATVKGITMEMLKDLGAQVVLANTYHLYLQPGAGLVAQSGGLHKFMNWSGPTMTDSGGFQVFSLGTALGKNITKFTKSGAGQKTGFNDEIQIGESELLKKGADEQEVLNASISGGSVAGGDENSPAMQIMKPAQIDPKGVMFRSVIDGSAHYFTPEKSIQIQHDLGADIIFAFDECTSPNEPVAYQAESLDRTHRWAKESLAYHLKAVDESGTYGEVGQKYSDRQALFGIVQGGRYEHLRKESAEVLANMKIDGRGFDGFGIGGSFAKEDMSKAVEWVNSVLPEDKPRHLLGIGEAEDLFEAVENGCDLFDCVMPTRNGRTGTLLTKFGKINIVNAKYKDDMSPIEEGCECYACKNYTRAYLCHLFKAKEMLAGTLATVHNLYFTINLVKNMRQALLEGRFAEFKEQFLRGYLK